VENLVVPDITDPIGWSETPIMAVTQRASGPTSWGRWTAVVASVVSLVLAAVVGTALAAPESAASTSVAVPSTPVGTQLKWLLSITALPLSTSEISAHFDAAFLAQISPAQLNVALSTLSESGSLELLGLSHPGPTSLTALVSFGTTAYNATLGVDDSGLIDTLLFRPALGAAPTTWAGIDRQLSAIAPGVGFLAARLNSNGTCTTAHSVDPSTPRPLGSMFKLFVLGALANAIRAHTVSWTQEVTVTAALKVGGSGTLQSVPDGTTLTVEQVALDMISQSDNTGADLLIGLLGRAAVEAQVRKWSAHPALDFPFLTVSELFALHYAHFPAMAAHYLALKPKARPAYLSSTVDKVPSSDEIAATAPRDINTVEWFASPDDLCRVFSGLTALQSEPGLGPLGTILSTNNGGIGLSSTTWPTIWFKGGSESGVLTLGYLARDDQGHTYVVIALTDNPARPLGPTATDQLVQVVVGAFGILH
jgi:beta-lactamase class A